MAKILWIEDDYYHVKGLFLPLETEGFQIVSSTSANDAFKKVQKWQDYVLIVVDIILPLRDQQSNELLPEVRNWENEEFAGIGLLKYIYQELHITIPVIVISVAVDDLTGYLEKLGVDDVLLKKGLLPRQVQESVHEVLETKHDRHN